MNETLLEALEKELTSGIKELGTMSTTRSEYATSIENIKRLNDLIEREKGSSEQIDYKKEELELKKYQTICDFLKIGAGLCTTAVSVGYAVWAFKNTLEFEQTGIFKSKAWAWFIPKGPSKI